MKTLLYVLELTRYIDRTTLTAPKLNSSFYSRVKYESRSTLDGREYHGMLEKGQELSANLTTIVSVEEQREENADVLPEDCNRGILLQVQVSIPSALLSPLFLSRKRE